MCEVFPSWNRIVVSTRHLRRVAVERGDDVPVALLDERRGAPCACA